MAAMMRWVKKADRWLHSHVWLLIILCVMIALRLPNFFEPYWYGDEGIYLTVGQAIRDGEKLYTQIVDHKTPLIYYLAAVPNQLSFRFVNVAWMLVATIAFYNFSQKLLSSQLAQFTSLAVFVLLTSLPWFEGNIPNGELFVMGFILLGGWSLSTTRLFQSLFDSPRTNISKKLQLTRHDLFKLSLAGISLGLGILTKVPAVFDAVALMMIGWYSLTNRFKLTATSKQQRAWLKLAGQLVLNLLVIGLAILIPILASIVFYLAVGSGQDYLQLGLLYNFRYAGSWGLPFVHPLLSWLFTLPGKLTVASLIILLLTLKKKWFSPAGQVIIGWMILSLVAALLSNRPYPHYFLQVIPPLALLIGLVVTNLTQLRKPAAAKSTARSAGFKPVELILAGVVTSSWLATLLVLRFHPYPTLSYYQRFYQLLAGQLSPAAYRQSFNWLMTDNYRAAELIHQAKEDEIFIWGTNAMLYALSGTQPVGRFTVSFHIKDFDAYDETMAAIIAKQPKFIVTMNDEHQSLPGLENYLNQFYLPNDNFDHFVLWRRFDHLN